MIYGGGMSFTSIDIEQRRSRTRQNTRRKKSKERKQNLISGPPMPAPPPSLTRPAPGSRWSSSPPPRLSCVCENCPPKASQDCGIYSSVRANNSGNERVHAQATNELNREGFTRSSAEYQSRIMGHENCRPRPPTRST